MKPGYDLDEVIAICREASEAGERQSYAVMEAFDVDVKRAWTMIKVAKRHRPDHGIPADQRGPNKGRDVLYDRALVAQAVWHAFDRNERLASALSARFGMSERYATHLMSAMRNAGYSLPYCPTAPHGPHLRARGCPCKKCQGDTPQVEQAQPAPVKVTVVGTIQLPEAAIPMGPWVNDAACRGINTNLFYPERGDPTKHALEVCKTCTVKADCLQYAIDNCERWGVWGGMTERQRRRIRSDRYQARRNIA